MAVTRVSPLPGKDGQLGDVNNRRATRRWLVLVSSRTDDEITVLQGGIQQGKLPTPFFDFHPTWFGLLCRSLRAEQDEGSPTKWIVTAEYSSQPLGQFQQYAQFTPPLDRPAQIRWRKNKYQKAQTNDATGQPYLNSAGDPFDPPVELARSYPVAVITKNVAATPAFFLTLGDAINSVPFFIEDLYVDTHQAKLDDWDRTELQIETDLNGALWLFYTLTWSCEINTDPGPATNPGSGGWLVNVLDAGMQARRSGAGAGNKFKILDNSTPPQPITTPALLDGQGFQLQNPSASTAKYRTFHGFAEVDFNQFPLV